jgi:membrane fusion protein (multidrug efflux system)
MKKSLRFVLFAAVVVFVIGIIGFRATHRASAAKIQRQQPVAAVKIAQPVVETITSTLEYTGNMMPIQQAGVYSKVTGNLEAVYANIGEAVRGGQLLAVIDTTLLAQQYAQTAATYENAKIQYERARDLFAQNLGPKQDVDNTQAAMIVAQANANNAATQLSYARITAPFTGVITQRFLDPGAVITANNATLFTLMDLDSMRVFINVLERDIPAVTTGRRATITVDAYPDRQFDGVVTRSSQAIDPNTRTMMVEIDVPNREHTLKGGMFSRVTLVVGEHPSSVTLPTQAVLGDSTGNWVFTVGENNLAHRVPVKIGIAQNNLTEITSGLSGQERVIVVGQQFVKDGAPVNIQS